MSKTKFLTKEDIFGANDIQVDEMVVPEWGGKIGVKVMSARERQEFQAKMGKGKGDEVPIDLMETLLVMTVVNPGDKSPLFTLKDIKTLSEKSSQVIGRIFEKAAYINGLTAGATEDIKKN